MIIEYLVTANVHIYYYLSLCAVISKATDTQNIQHAIYHCVLCSCIITIQKIRVQKSLLSVHLLQPMVVTNNLGELINFKCQFLVR